MRYAMVTEANWPYRYGLNAVLNGLDYHGNKNIDFYYLYDHDVPDWYLEKSTTSFDFSVFPLPLARYVEKYPPLQPDCRWPLVYYRYKLASLLADQYDALMILDSDFLICGYLEHYFGMVAGTDLILLPNFSGLYESPNEASSEYFRKRYWSPEGKRYFITNPSSPFLASPASNVHVYAKVFENGARLDMDMWSLWEALLELNLVEKIVTLPGALWCNSVYTDLLYSYMKVDEKWCFFVEAGKEKVMMAHRRWWSREEMEGERDKHTRQWNAEFIGRNVENFLTESKRINTEWKLPLEWHVP